MIVDNINDWWIETNADGSLRTGKNFTEIKSGSKLLCDLLPTIKFNTVGNQKGVSIYGQQIILYTGTGNKDINELRSWVQQNPLTIQYQLATESIKTVDLTIHDKDQQKVERLTSFVGGTHFTTSSQEGSLLPTLSVDVVTDLEETLKVCSLEGNTM